MAAKIERNPAIRMEFSTPAERQAFKKLTAVAKKYGMRPTTYCRRIVMLRIGREVIEKRPGILAMMRTEIVGPEQLEIFKKTKKEKAVTK